MAEPTEEMSSEETHHRRKRSSDDAMDVGSLKQPRAAESGTGCEVRLCFAYLNNNGQCSRGAACKFRHVEPDHPDAIADRVKTGHVSKLAGILPAEKVHIKKLVGSLCVKCTRFLTLSLLSRRCRRWKS